MSKRATTTTFAAAQSVPVPGDVGANTLEHLRLIGLATGEGADVVIFPELSLTGYELDLAPGLAFSATDPRLDPFVDAASGSGATLVVGAPVRLATGLHIGAFIITGSGAVDLYTKQHLGSGEEAVMAPGHLDPLVDSGSWTSAVAICADANHPSHPAAAAQRGVHTYLVSTFITPNEFARKTTTLRNYARTYGMAVVFSNYGGPSGGLAAAGGSAIWDPRGQPVAQLEGTGSGVVLGIHERDVWTGEAINAS